jgi:hypothetical protein
MHRQAGKSKLEYQINNAANKYNEFKEFKGKKYTGMKVGGRHVWHYEKGQWKEKKIAPEKWEFSYDVKKRRAREAPEGSGVPVGTQYHWYILADQIVTKLDANNYSTSMSGLKYKLAHKRAEKTYWNASDRRQRNVLINILQEMIEELRKDKTLENVNEKILLKNMQSKLPFGES